MLQICQYYTGNICQMTYMWAQYKYHIRHLTYMVHICQFYMQHICQMPNMLLILSTHMCMYEDIMCTIYVTYMAFRIYGAYMSVLHGEYMSNDIYVIYIAHLYVHVCMHRCDQYK